ncbi:MAG: DUF5050 domain-containing protein [Bacilli bacterium]|nr:DUF5050 domain-containing protein [Bacilli bacterium]
MKKKVLLIPVALSLFLVSCGGDNPPSSDSASKDITSQSGTQTSESSEPKKDFTGVYFQNASFTYDGSPHILGEVTGAPSGTTITYSGRNEYINVGTYEATATLQKEGYNDKVLTATLTINRATFEDYSYENKTVRYDGNDHIDDIQLVGVLPAGTNTSETVKDSNGRVVTSAIEVGTYNYTCVVTNSNYTTMTLEATLTIVADKTSMPVFVANDGTIYFANGLHDRYIYSLNSSSEFKLIDYSTPKEFYKYSSSKAIFIAGTTILNTVKEVGEGSTNSLYTESNIDDFVKFSDTIYYFSKNSLRSSSSGIFKVDATDTENEPVVTKIFEGKSDNLTLYGNELYFTNGNDHNYIYKMNLSTYSTSLVAEEKVHEMIISGNKLYCTINGTLNDYIGSINLSSSTYEVDKLTNASGEYLKIKNGYLYYNYTDLFSVIDSSLKGIWRISVNGGTPEQLVANEGVNGFDVESSSSLLYIDSTDLHLYRYNTTNNRATDLLQGFVAPESTPLNLGGKTISYGSKTYYLDMYAGKTLCVYDESSRKSQQLTSNKVEDFCIYDDILYFNQVTLLTNNDLYAVRILTGGEAEKINTNDVRNMYIDGEYIYATHYNWAGVSGGISRMKLDGSEYVKFSEVNGAKNFSTRDGKLYYINCGNAQDNGYIEYVSLSDITPTTEGLAGTRLSSNIKNVKQFAFDGNNIFYIYNGLTNNSVRRTDFSSLGAGTEIASSKTNPSEIILSGNYVYYYSYASTSPSNAGFYRVSKQATSDGTQELLAGYESKYYATSLSISDTGYLYFLNYIPKLVLGDAHFYQLNLNSKNIVKIK